MLNRHLIKRGMKVNSKFYNPEKHTYLNRHHEDYADSKYWPGRILKAKRLPAREANEVYLEQTATYLFQYLKQAYPKSFKFGWADYEKVKNNTFYCYDVKLDEHLFEIFDHLNENLTVKEHRFRPAVEKKFRDEGILYSGNFKETIHNLTIDQFVQKYSDYVESLVLLSNNGQRINKLLDTSDLEAEYGRGGNSYICVEGKNDNFINRIMKYIH